MNGDFIPGLGLIVLVVLSALTIVGFHDKVRKEYLLTKCAKENNVYECELVAVPKKASE